MVVIDCNRIGNTHVLCGPANIVDVFLKRELGERVRRSRLILGLYISEPMLGLKGDGVAS